MGNPSSEDSPKERKSTHTRVIELIHGRGHENIRGTHGSTFEITKDKELTERGGCIVTMAASKSMADLSYDFKKNLCNDDARLTIIFEANGLKEIAVAMGSKELTLENPKDLVIRKSNFICDRTLAIRSNKAAIDFNRSFIDLMQDPNMNVKIELIVERGY